MTALQHWIDDRDRLEIYTNLAPSSISGSGPIYTVSYGFVDVSAIRQGMLLLVKKREAGAGTGSAVQSFYVYTVYDVNTSISPTQIQYKYLTDSAGDGDDSPADLPSGGGSSGSPGTAKNDIIMILGPAFEMFVE